MFISRLVKLFRVKAVLAVILIILISMVLTGCRQQPKTTFSNESKEDINWQALAANYNPPNVSGLLNAIKQSNTKADGNIVITNEIKREFNHMGEDYRFFFMPNVKRYDFESTGAAMSYLIFTWTGKFGTFPEKVPKYEAEARLRKIFAAPNDQYPKLKHQGNRGVQFDGDSYRLLPESYNAATMVYDLANLSVRRDGDYAYYTALANEYQFDLTNDGHKPGENEVFLSERTKVLGLDSTKTLSKLLETGEITKAVKSRAYTIEFRIKGDSILPQIVSVNKS